MKIVSWNVNGITSRRRALIKFLNSTQPDIFCVQETKTECPLATPQYEQIWFSGERKGYAGTLVLTKREPIAITKGIGVEKFDVEGRTITLEFSDFFVVNTYVPSYNTASTPDRREYRIEWDRAFLEYVTSLPKPAVLAGDFNVAREAIDSYSDKSDSSIKLAIRPSFFPASSPAGLTRNKASQGA